MEWGDILFPILLLLGSGMIAAGYFQLRNPIVLRVATFFPAVVFGIWLIAGAPEKTWEIGFGFDRQLSWDPKLGVGFVVLWAALSTIVERAEWFALGGLLLSHLSHSPWFAGVGFALCWFAKWIESKTFSEVELSRPFLALLLFAAAAVLPGDTGREALVCAGALALVEGSDLWRKQGREERVLSLFTALAGLQLLAAVRGSVSFSEDAPIAVALVAAAIAFRAFFSLRSLPEAALAAGTVWILSCPAEWAAPLSLLFSLLGVFGFLLAGVFSANASVPLRVLRMSLGAWVLGGGFGSPLIEYWQKLVEQFPEDPWRWASLAAVVAAFVWAYLREADARRSDKASNRTLEGWKTGVTLFVVTAFVARSYSTELNPLVWIPIGSLLGISALTWQLELRFHGLKKIETIIHRFLSSSSIRCASFITTIAAWEPRVSTDRSFGRLLAVSQRVASRVGVENEEEISGARRRVSHEHIGKLLGRAFFAHGATELFLACVLAAILFWSLIVYGML